MIRQTIQETIPETLRETIREKIRKEMRNKVRQIIVQTIRKKSMVICKWRRRTLESTGLVRTRVFLWHV